MKQSCKLVDALIGAAILAACSGGNGVAPSTPTGATSSSQAPPEQIKPGSGVAEFLYVTSGASSSEGSVSAYAINSGSGALTQVYGSPFGAGNGAEGVAVAPTTGTFAYVANTGSDYGAGSVSAYTINPSSGALTQVAGSPFGAGNYPQQVAVFKGKFVYVANAGDYYGAGSVSGYTINPGSGALTQVPGSPFGAGSNPVGVATDPTGKFVYVTNNVVNSGGSVYAYAINPASGALTQVYGSPFGTGRDPTSVAFDPKGKFLYVPDEGDNNVSAYTINPSSGALTQVAGSPFGANSHPFSVAVDPKGAFVYVTNHSGADSVSAFTINPSSGALTQVAGSPFGAGPDPAGVAIDRGSKFLYVANSGGHSVSAYTINASSGALTQVYGSPFATEGFPVDVATCRVIDGTCKGRSL